MHLRPAVLAMLVLLTTATPALAGHHPATMKITAGPSGTIDTGDAEFRFSASKPDVDPVCRLTGPGQSGTFAACATSTRQTYGGLANGSYTFSVRDSRFSSAPVASRAFTVAKLDTTITAGPSGPTNDATPAFSFSGTSASAFQCRVDGAAFATCSSPFTTAMLADGPHTFEVRALGARGTPDPTPAARSFTVDTIAPTTTITAATTALTLTPQFTFSSDSAATFACRVDAAAFAPCTSPHTTAALSQGIHTFEVRATDAAGNADPSPAARTFLIDVEAPVAPALSGPSGPINTATAAFTFTTAEIEATFECALDDGAYSACTSPQDRVGLADGAHTFRVRVVDSAGLRGAESVRQFTVDTTPPPVPAVISGPSGPTNETSPAFTFEASETVTCRLDGPSGPVVAEVPCTSPTGFASLAPGDYVFVVRSVDAVGNASETRRAFTVTLPPPAAPAQIQPPPAPTVQTVVVEPAAGTVLIRRKGASRFVRLTAITAIPYGSEVDARKGRARLTALPRVGARPETGDYYLGQFTVHKAGQITELRLSQKLTGCERASRRARAAQSKPKSRKLWGNGKGSFRTRGQYSSATVRGTTWLVQDTCTATVTRVTEGVVAVKDFAKDKTVLVKKGKRYTARRG